MIHQQHRSRPLVATLAVAVCLVAATATAKDLRTITVRVVPNVAWQAAPTSVAISSENHADHEKAAEFLDYLNDWIGEALGQLGYQVAETGDKADVELHCTLEVYDPGSAAKRWAIGFGAGKSYVEGTITIRRADQVLGSYRFSARPKGVSPKGLAKEVGPPVVLQIHNGEADEELHEYEPRVKTG